MILEQPQSHEATKPHKEHSKVFLRATFASLRLCGSSSSSKFFQSKIPSPGQDEGISWCHLSLRTKYCRPASLPANGGAPPGHCLPGTREMLTCRLPLPRTVRQLSDGEGRQALVSVCVVLYATVPMLPLVADTIKFLRNVETGESWAGDKWRALWQL